MGERVKDYTGRMSMLIRHYISLVIIFILQKPLFMLYARLGRQSYGVRDWLLVIWHGLPIDLSVAAYLTLIPLLFIIMSVWTQSFPVKGLIKFYDFLAALVLSAIFVGDCALYPYWGFKLDASVFFYLKTPKEAMASVSLETVVIGVASILILTAIIYGILKKALKPYKTPYNKVLMRVPVSLIYLLLLGPLFIAIRGGVSESTMNVGHAYFSTDQFLNHSAVNPSFSLLSSMSKTSDYSKWYDYLEESNRSSLFEGLYPVSDDNTEKLLKTNRPNILVLVMEGMGGDFVNAISGRPDVTPCLDSLINEGVFFSNCYAGSFRTDRGLVCIMNGHPGLPMTSIMKMPHKSAALPSMASKMAGLGYNTYFTYGGDINFTNMRGWLFDAGFQNVVSGDDFTMAERHTNPWGVQDQITFGRLLKDIREYKDPWFGGYLSLSSHEPFDVPYDRLEDKICNAFAYADSCLGHFVRTLQKTPEWNNLLLMILPDHGFRYPQEGFAFDPHVHHIPVLWLGGAVRKPVKIDRFTAQSDMAATILGQLDVDHSDFLFSRNVLSSSYDYPFSFYTFSNGFCFIDSTGVTLYDDDASKCLINDSFGSEERLNRGKAIVQTLYDDLEER